MKNVALYTSSIIFLIVSILHFGRLLAKIAVVVGTHTIPLDWSLYGGIVTLLLCIWMFVAAKMKSRHQVT